MLYWYLLFICMFLHWTYWEKVMKYIEKVKSCKFNNPLLFCCFSQHAIEHSKGASLQWSSNGNVYLAALPQIVHKSTKRPTREYETLNKAGVSCVRCRVCDKAIAHESECESGCKSNWESECKFRVWRRLWKHCGSGKLAKHVYFRAASSPSNCDVCSVSNCACESPIVNQSVNPNASPMWVI